MLASGTTDMRFSLAGKKDGDLVCWGCGNSWAITWTWEGRVRRARCFAMRLACRVGHIHL